jgi:hypothetical protein
MLAIASVQSMTAERMIRFEKRYWRSRPRFSKFEGRPPNPVSRTSSCSTAGFSNRSPRKVRALATILCMHRRALRECACIAARRSIQARPAAGSRRGQARPSCYSAPRALRLRRGVGAPIRGSCRARRSRSPGRAGPRACPGFSRRPRQASRRARPARSAAHRSGSRVRERSV